MMTARFSLILCLACLLATVTLASAPAPARAQMAQTAYFSEQPDLPLPQGFQENQGAGLVFDQGPLRVAELVASGPLSPEGVIAFYAEALPMLGWVRQADQPVFHRENEQLTLQVQSIPQGTIFRLRLEPVK